MATDATLVETHDTPGHDTLVPDPQVQKEFGVTAMSIWRWDRDPELIKLAATAPESSRGSRTPGSRGRRPCHEQPSPKACRRR